jgi:hypothetical protein
LARTRCGPAGIEHAASYYGHALPCHVARSSPESAGKRRDGKISREGSAALRRALIDLGLGLWLSDPAAKAYAAALKSRGKHGGIITCPRPQPLRLDPLDLS